MYQPLILNFGAFLDHGLIMNPLYVSIGKAEATKLFPTSALNSLLIIDDIYSWFH